MFKKEALDRFPSGNRTFWNGETLILLNADETPKGNDVNLRQRWYKNKKSIVGFQLQSEGNFNLEVNVIVIGFKSCPPCQLFLSFAWKLPILSLPLFSIFLLFVLFGFPSASLSTHSQKWSLLTFSMATNALKITWNSIRTCVLSTVKGKQRVFLLSHLSFFTHSKSIEQSPKVQFKEFLLQLYSHEGAKFYYENIHCSMRMERKGEAEASRKLKQ